MVWRGLRGHDDEDMNVNRDAEPTDAVGGAGAATRRVANSPPLPERISPKARAHTVRFEIPPATMIQFILVVAGLWLLIRLWPVFLVLVVALLIVGTLSPAVSWMEARRSSAASGSPSSFTLLFVVAMLVVTADDPGVSWRRPRRSSSRSPRFAQRLVGLSRPAPT